MASKSYIYSDAGNCIFMDHQMNPEWTFPYNAAENMFMGSFFLFQMPLYLLYEPTS